MSKMLYAEILIVYIIEDAKNESFKSYMKANSYENINAVCERKRTINV